MEQRDLRSVTHPFHLLIEVCFEYNEQEAESRHDQADVKTPPETYRIYTLEYYQGEISKCTHILFISGFVSIRSYSLSGIGG